MWHRNIFVCERHLKGKGYLILIGTHNEKHVPIVIVNVYSPCDSKSKWNLCEELVNIRKNERCKTWCMMGDFNAVKKADERKGLNIRRTNKRENIGFNNFIEKTEMIELPYVGRKYTWYRPNGNAKSRIDRIFVSCEWLDHWPGYRQYILDRQISDHCAIIIKNTQVDWGPKPFRCLHVWHTDIRFRDIVKQK